MTWGKAENRRIADRYIATIVNWFWSFSRQLFRLGLAFSDEEISDEMLFSDARLRFIRRRNSMFNSKEINIKFSDRNVEFTARLTLRKICWSIPVNCRDEKHNKYNRLSEMKINVFFFVTILLKLCGHFMAIYWDHDKAKTIKKE